jgi:glycosyltransferase involved in cell wall biosynthesis
MSAALWIIGALWTLHSLLALAGIALVPGLPGRRGQTRPRIAAIVAARDEQDRIAETARRLLDQEGVDLRLFIADDRSADRTPEILSGLARDNDRLTPVRIDELPAGWLGKCHACRAAATRALAESDPDYLLFIDADVWLEPDVAARAAAEAERSGAAHVTLLPGFARSEGLGPAAVLASLTPFMTRAAMANLALPGQQVGIGGFNLIRRETYEAFGGHEALRLEIVDDLYLAVLSTRAGGRTRVLRAFHDVEVEYAVSLHGLLAVTRKNNYAIFRFRPMLSSLAIVAFLAAWLGALAGPALAVTMSLPAGWVAFGGLCTTIVPALVFARLIGWSPVHALLAPLAQGALPAMLANSMIATHREGGVRWRETLYPLAQLRAGRVR